jgi:hypothetical protein
VAAELRFGANRVNRSRALTIVWDARPSFEKNVPSGMRWYVASLPIVGIRGRLHSCQTFTLDVAS